MTPAEITAILIATATLVSSIGGLVVAWRTGTKVQQTHDLVNGQSQQVGQLREAIGHATGLAEGKADIHR